MLGTELITISDTMVIACCLSFQKVGKFSQGCLTMDSGIIFTRNVIYNITLRLY